MESNTNGFKLIIAFKIHLKKTERKKIMEHNEKVEIIKKALEDKKAKNIEVINVAEHTSIAEFFIICSCTSGVQVRACTDEVEEKLNEHGEFIHHKEGYRGGAWVLIDAGDVIVHVMTEETREFYDIERLWK